MCSCCVWKLNFKRRRPRWVWFQEMPDWLPSAALCALAAHRSLPQVDLADSSLFAAACCRLPHGLCGCCTISVAVGLSPLCACLLHLRRPPLSWLPVLSRSSWFGVNVDRGFRHDTCLEIYTTANGGQIPGKTVYVIIVALGTPTIADSSAATTTYGLSGAAAMCSREWRKPLMPDISSVHLALCV